jgi:hypothetical protein
VRRSWFHPYLFPQILRSIHAHGDSISPAVNHLVLTQSVLFAGLNESTVRTWFSAGMAPKEENLTPFARSAIERGAGFARPTGRVAHLDKYPAVQAEILELLANMRQSGVCFDGPTVRNIIISVIEARVPALLATNGGSFHVSPSWVASFVYNKLKWVRRCITSDSQHLPPDYEKIVEDFNLCFAFLCFDKEGAEADLDAAVTEQARRELARSLLRGGGDGPPVGALMFSCAGRGRALFGAPHRDAAALSTLLPLPVADCHANGEVGQVGGRTFLHMFTVVFALLRARRWPRGGDAAADSVQL